MSVIKKVVSISLGSSLRDKITETEILGCHFIIQRIGVDGDRNKMVQMIKKFDGKVDVITTGGIHINYVTLNRTMRFRETRRYVNAATKTPVIDGETYREIVEPMFIKQLIDKKILNPKQKVLFPMVANRFAIVKQMYDCGFKNFTFGDLIYNMDINVPLHSLKRVNFLYNLLGPIITKLPFSWIYPLGVNQEVKKEKRPDLFEKADIIAGDFHSLNRYLIDDLSGKTIITNTLTKRDKLQLKNKKACKLITFSPEFGGRVFGSNVINGIIMALLNKHPNDVSKENYLAMVNRAGFEPNVEYC
jgi:hypothetical protein